MNLNEPPYHRWPRSYGGWQAGSIIRCEGEDCQWCKSRWRLVDNETLEEITMDADGFNERYPIGTPVTVTKDDGSIIETVTRSAAWTLGSGHPVVMVVGISGGYSLERVAARAP